jgi:hypothetical protein
VAHRGKPDVPVTITGIPMASAGLPGPTPPAAVPGGRGREPVRPEEGTIDGWFLDRLFSRH